MGIDDRNYMRRVIPISLLVLTSNDMAEKDAPILLNLRVVRGLRIFIRPPCPLNSRLLASKARPLGHTDL